MADRAGTTGKAVKRPGVRQLGVIRTLAISRELLYVVTSFEREEAGLAPSRLYQYDHGTWRFNEYGFLIQSLVLYQAPGAALRALCIASEQGAVLFPHDESRREAIVNRSAPPSRGKRLGRITKVTQIGDHLYACGEGGQTYRRNDNGDWAVLDPKLLDDEEDRYYPYQITLPDGQPLGTYRPDVFLKYPEIRDEYIRRLLATNVNTIVRKLAGDTEQRIFAAASKGRVLCWTGAGFQDVPTGSTSALTDVLVDGDQVLVCGRDGAFLAGNERDGFHQLACATGAQVFTSMAAFNGLIYLASNAMPQGLFVSDLTRLEPVQIDLDPGITSISTVQAVDGVLWLTGQRDIARYDGRAWTRIDLPKPTRPRKGRNGG